VYGICVWNMYVDYVYDMYIFIWTMQGICIRIWNMYVCVYVYVICVECTCRNVYMEHV